MSGKLNVKGPASFDSLVQINKLANIHYNGTSAKTANFTAEAGYIYLVTKLDGCEVTLPKPTRGDRIKIIFGGTTSNSHTVTTNAAEVLLGGYALVEDTANGDAAEHAVFAPDGADDRQLELNATTTGLSGVVELTGTSDVEWLVEARLTASGTVATPFS